MPKTKIFKFFGFITRLAFIERWSLMYSTKKENVKEHSFDVAAITHSLVAIGNAYFGGNLDVAKAAMYGLFHDADESITGDMPTPVKYFSESVKAAADHISALAVAKMVSCHPPELQEIYRQSLVVPSEYKRIVKAADKIAALAKCLDEKKRGNSHEFSLAEKRHKEDLASMIDVLPEVGYFLEHYLPGFQLSLEELCDGNGSSIIDSDGGVV